MTLVQGMGLARLVRRVPFLRLAFVSRGVSSRGGESPNDVAESVKLEPVSEDRDRAADTSPAVAAPKGRDTERGRDFRVSRSTEPRSLGLALASQLRKHGLCQVMASGEAAVENFVKGAATARDYLLERREGDLSFQPYHSFWMDRNSANQIVFIVQRTETPFAEQRSPERLRVSQRTDMRQLSKSIKAKLSKTGIVDVHGIGTTVIACAVVAAIWTRRLLLCHKCDLDCWPSFRDVDGTVTPRDVQVLCLTLTQRAVGDAFLDSKSLFALKPLPFYFSLEQLPTIDEAFAESVYITFPVVKIAAATSPNRAAGAFLTTLRSCRGVQVLSSGVAANNQALKAMAVCRRYVREVAGYDVAFTCIHGPRENRDGECQVVAWLHLIPDASQRLAVLDGEKVDFRIGNTNDAMSVGQAMAAQLAPNGRLDCVSLGIAAAARLLVAISHTRVLLTAKGLDAVALPQFDVEEHQEQSLVQLRCDVLSFQQRKQ